MKKGEDLIQRARESAARKAGVRMKARIPDALWGRVRRCADAACMPAEEWVNLSCRAWMSARFDCVPFDEKLTLVTRDNSNAQWVRIPHDMDQGKLKQALLQAVLWHEPKIRPVTPQKGTEGWIAGRDYKLAKCE